MTRRSGDRATIDESELAALMGQYQQGSAAAAEELVRKLSPLLLRFVSVPRFTRSQNQDLLQDCWLQVHRARHTFRPGSRVLPWLLAIARHVRRDAWRRQARISSHELGWQAGDDVLAAALPDPGFCADLVRCLNQLPKCQRDVLLMLKVSGMSLREVADATASSVGAVKLRAHRAYCFLRHCVGPALGPAK